jgi:hypothetical protein
MATAGMMPEMQPGHAWRADAKYLWLLAMKQNEISTGRSEDPAHLVILQQDSLGCISAACTKMCG